MSVSVWQIVSDLTVTVAGTKVDKFYVENTIRLCYCFKCRLL